MSSKLKNVLRKLKKNYYDICAIKHLRKLQKNCNSGPVVFICQFESVWNKSEAVYLTLKERKCEVKLLVVKDKTKFDGDKTLFERKYPEDVVLYEEGILDKLKPSLVMYSRPYESLLPKDIQASSAIKKCKTGFIPYYYSLENDYSFSISYEFIRNICLFFADQKATQDYFNDSYPKNIKQGLQKSFNVGYPALEATIEKVESNEPKLNLYKNNNRCKVMWTPRWTTDERIGGSNFLKYYKQLFELMNNNDKYSFLFRPHPMLFDNFLENKYITKEEYENLINLISNSTNMFYDKTSEYFDTFCNTDILISDNSSIIVEYLLTGKPMIYCFNKSNFVFNEIMNELLECNYVVDNWEELVKVLNDLHDGKDYKKESRMKLVARLKDENLQASSKIADSIVNNIESKKSN